MKKWSSHEVKTLSDIVHSSSHPMNHDRTFRPITGVCGQVIDILQPKQPKQTLARAPFLSLQRKNHPTASMVILSMNTPATATSSP